MTNQWNLKSPTIIGINLEKMRITSDDITKLMLPDQMDIITRAAPRMRRRSLSVEDLYFETLRASNGLRKGQEEANVALQSVIVFARAVGGD